MPTPLSRRRIHRPFRLDQVPGLVAWLDASDPAAYTLSGSTVNRAYNRAIPGMDAVQSDGTKQPGITTINGRTAFSFDGSNDCLQIPSLPLYPSMTLFVVYRQTASNSKLIFMEHGADTNINDGFFLYGLSPSTVTRRAPNINSNTDAALALYGTDARLLTFTASPSISATGLIHSLRKNRSNLAMSVAGTNSGTTVANTLTTATLNIGSRNNGAAVAFDGAIGELAIYSPEITPSNWGRVENHLSEKWGTP